MQTIVNLGTGGADLNGRNGSTTSADSNDALFLDWPGDNGGNYVYLPGVLQNHLSVPDESALDITGDIDVRLHLALDNWSNGSQALMSKWDSVTLSNQRGWIFYIQNDRKLVFNISENGISQSVSTSSVGITAVDRVPLWLRVTYRASDGRVQFFQSNDGVSWTQVGSDQTNGASAIFSNTAAISVGSFNAGTGFTITGSVYRAQVLNGIDGSTVLDVDTSAISSGSDTSFTALTGQTVTINRSTSGRKSVAVVTPVWLFGTDDYMEVADNALLDFGASESLTVVAAHRVWNTQGTNDTLVAKKSNTTNTTQGWSLSGGSSTALAGQAQIGDGSAGITATSSNRVAGQLTVLAAVRDVAADTLTVFRNGLAGSAVTDTTTSSLSNAEVLRIARLSGAGMEYADMELVGVAVLRRALSPTEVAQVTAYYQARLS